MFISQGVLRKVEGRFQNSHPLTFKLTIAIEQEKSNAMQLKAEAVQWGPGGQVPSVVFKMGFLIRPSSCSKCLKWREISRKVISVITK